MLYEADDRNYIDTYDCITRMLAYVNDDLIAMIAKHFGARTKVPSCA